MAKLNRRSISRRTVEALEVDKDTVFWDRDQPGFGIRVYASGAKTYIVQSRAKGRSVRVTVGRHGVISADEARRRAARIVNRIKAGEAPVPEPLPARLAGRPTVADLAARYMEQHVAVRCKASTAVGIRKLLGKHVLPEFGRLPLMAVERERVAAFHARLNGVPYAANRAVAPLSPPPARVLADLPRVPDNPWVIPGQKPGTRMTNLDGPWQIVRRRAKLDGVRIHDLRHSFASRALALGESLPAIAKLLGHSQIQTTARYAHLARDSVKASAARVAASIAVNFLGQGAAPKMPRR